MRLNWSDKLEKSLLAAAVITMAATSSFAEESKKSGFEDQVKMVPGDEEGNELKALKTELFVDKTEKQALAQLNKLLRKYRGTSMEATLLFRKAELHIRRAKTQRFYELHRDSETIVRLAPQKVRGASSRKELFSAIEIYDRIQRQFKQFNDLDLVMFNNAFARQQVDQKASAKKLYRDLLHQFPYSPLRPDAHLALGEMLYNEKSFKTALGQYKEIMKYPESRVYPYGIYKAAWAYYNMTDTASGLAELEKLIAFSESQKAKDNSIDLRQEALNDMVLFFSDYYKPEKAYGYFDKFANDKELGPLLLRLAGLYDHHGKHKAVQTVLLTYIKKQPQSEKRIAAHEFLVNTYEKALDRPGAVDQIEKMAAHCTSLDDKKSPCVETVRKVSHRFSSKWHRTWKKNQKAKGVEVIGDSAERAYVVRIAHEQNSEEDYKIRFSYAELLFQRNKFRMASDNYFVVGKMAKDKNLVHDSSYASIVSLEKAVNNKWEDKDELRFLDLAKVYLDRNPKGKYQKDIRFKRSFIAYEKGRYDEAAPDLKKLGYDYAKTDKGRKAQDLFLDILNIQKKFTELKENAKNLSKIEKNQKRKASLKALYQQAYFSEIQEIESGSAQEKAANEYITFARQNTGSNLADKAFWNGVSLFKKLGDMQKVAELSFELSKTFPNSEYRTPALVQSAKIYEDLGQLKEAAGVLLDMASAQGPKELEWRELAAEFLRLEGSRAQAEKQLRVLVSRGSALQKEKAYNSLWKLERKYGTQESRKDIENEILTKNIQPASAAILLDRAESQFENKNYPEAFKTAGWVLSSNLTSDDSVYYKSRARMVQARILDNEYRQQSVKSRPDRLALVLGIKTEKLDKAQQAYQSAARYGDPRIAVESLESLAECYNHYSQAVRGLELVGDLSPADIKAIKSELENLALPMEDKYVETTNDALKQARDLEVQGGVIARLQMKVDKLNMQNKTYELVEARSPSLALPQVGTL